jgi:hypothetical protein
VTDKLPPELLLQKKMPEWQSLQILMQDLKPFGKIHQLGVSRNPKTNYELPLIALSFGSDKPEAPTLGLFGGVHGLERIGSQVVLTLMRSFSELLAWDHLTLESLKHIRILFFPMINPHGILNRKRANPSGVDLMRNAPVEADHQVTPLLGGHKISSWLPWYRGEDLQAENLAVIEFCEKYLFSSRAAVTMDFHSGFGVQDRIWYPYAKSTEDFPHLQQTLDLFRAFDRTFPNHVYKIEPQSKSYTTHGDLWDYLHQEYCKKNPEGIYLPLTLEMGSWNWVKKNPLQLLTSMGAFHPVKPHREKRILRRHLTLFDFLIRSLHSNSYWTKK